MEISKNGPLLFIGKYTYMQMRKSTKLLDPANKHPKKIFSQVRFLDFLK